MLYKDAGIDIKKKETLLSYIREFSDEVGRFGGGVPMGDKMLIASVDGVGTKLLIASALNRHKTIGEDLVNHCVNDILCEGATPLFFMDYIGSDRLEQKIFLDIISGIREGCKKNALLLIGGETAELPSMYLPQKYDLVGFIVGITEHRITGENIKEGDILIGLSSNGLHTNGYSLVRKIIKEKRLSLDKYVQEFGQTLGEELLMVHRSYLKVLISNFPSIKGIAHITGGGFSGNIPRAIPSGYGVVIKKNSWDVPPIFEFIKKMGSVPEEEMYRVFNMGIGMVIIVDRDKTDATLSTIGEGSIIGEVTKGEGVQITNNQTDEV
ncbi:phosphoribosylformylglycinamidine cyclo-ligase [candidate division WOR-3 bacterium]|nr:phosphoribosylformylglycinamidine cyclo-ligase [candidate division WOR-3 bacterium]